MHFLVTSCIQDEFHKYETSITSSKLLKIHAPSYIYYIVIELQNNSFIKEKKKSVLV